MDNEFEEIRFPYAAIPWTDLINSDPIEDLRLYQKILANQYGWHGNKIEFNPNTVPFILDNKIFLEWVGKLNPGTLKDLSKLLWGGDSENEIEFIVDKDIPIGKVIVSLNDTIKSYEGCVADILPVEAIVF